MSFRNSDALRLSSDNEDSNGETLFYDYLFLHLHSNNF